MVHTETVHREKTICKICDKSFRSVAGLRAHNRAHHKWQEKIETPITDASFEDEKSVETHKQSECTPRSVEISASANDDFMSEQSESSVETIVSDAKNERNRGRTYRNRNKGIKPKRLRRDEKKYECVYCRRKYAAETSLSRHIIDHGIFSIFVLKPLPFHELFRKIDSIRSRWQPCAQVRLMSQIFQIA